MFAGNLGLFFQLFGDYHILTLQLSNGNGSARITLGPAHLDGLSALASHGFRPDRLSLALNKGGFIATGSHRLPGGRWLNIMVQAHGTSAAFPATRMTIGKLALPASLSRLVFEGGRLMIRLRGIKLPPLDQMVSDVAIGQDQLSVTLTLPSKELLIEEDGAPVDARKVAHIYCALTKAQQLAPESDFAAQLRRSFSQIALNDDPVAYNRAALVALAMFIVDERVGTLAGSTQVDIQSCRMPPQASSIHGRADLPKHWALSAALSVGTNIQLARAMGEWKELADSLSAQSSFAQGDPSGFSFVDIAADRSGFRIAQAAMSPEHAGEMNVRLSRATADQILPKQLLQGHEQMSEDEFDRSYGSIDDPRYQTAIERIDAVLDRASLE